MRTYDVETEWTAADLALLEDLRKSEEALPSDAPRALLSVRLSVLSDDTTSPVRQELDLRQLAREMGYRVVGVASDLNVSATRVPPWKRKELGAWLNDRAPEFDALLFGSLRGPGSGVRGTSRDACARSFTPNHRNISAHSTSLTPASAAATRPTASASPSAMTRSYVLFTVSGRSFLPL